MKKNLEAELMSLSHRILQMKNRSDVHELKAVAAVLHEKLSVLSHLEKHFEGAQPSIGKKEVEKSLGKGGNERYAPDGTLYNPEGITEPNTEKIKDILAQMPPESEGVDKVLEDILPDRKTPANTRGPENPEAKEAEAKKTGEDDDFKAHGVSYDNLPEFEPVHKKTDAKTLDENPSGQEDAPKKPSSLGFNNDQGPKAKNLHQKLKKGIYFGLNERVVFVKHLFGGNVSDYDRVLSQLNTFENYPEAKNFIEKNIKPDYDWKEEEKYEKQFLAAVKDRLG